MLKQRIITACVMALIFAAALFGSSWAVFVGLVGCVFLVGAWEWSALSGLSAVISRSAFAVLCVALAVALACWTDWAAHSDRFKSVLIAACSWWAVALLWIQSFPASAVLWRPLPVRLLMGLFVLLPAWLSVMYLRAQPDGIWVVLMCLGVVAAADIGAYFFGKAFGRRKLALAVSPGKSWEGAAGGLFTAVVFGLLFGMLLDIAAWPVLLAMVIPAAMVSVVGDLTESMLKRVQGMKDSGTILPGHGGILDRVDGLVAALPVFTLALLVNT